MTIKTYKVETYKKHKIYYRNFNRTFEYLTIIKSELYTSHIEVRPTFFRNIFAKLGILGDKYNEKQLQAIMKQLRIWLKQQ